MDEVIVSRMYLKLSGKAPQERPFTYKILILAVADSRIGMYVTM